MTPHTYLCLALAITAAMPITGALAQSPDSKIKILAAPKDPTQETILIGRTISDGMVLQLELEGAESMWMTMGAGRWSERAPTKDERYHVEFKATDLTTKTRIPYAIVTFRATNKDNGKSLKLALPPMWGSSGLHYSANSALAAILFT